MTSRIVVVGAGGHAKVCIEILVAMGEEIACCVSDFDGPDECLGYPVLRGDGNLASLRTKGHKKAFVAVGSNVLRDKLSNLCISEGYTIMNALSPSAVISPSAKLGYGIAVMPGAVINAASVIDDLVIVNTGATVDHDCHIKRSAHIAPQCALAGSVEVGAFCLLGLGCRVIPGVQIGDNSIVGAGGVVVSHLPPNVIAVGVPAKYLKVSG